jgi:hypothetical protein
MPIIKHIEVLVMLGQRKGLIGKNYRLKKFYKRKFYKLQNHKEKGNNSTSRTIIKERRLLKRPQE